MKKTLNDASRKYSDFATMMWHEIRLIYKQPLKQTGFVNLLFKMARLEIRCPNFSTLSNRLRTGSVATIFYSYFSLDTFKTVNIK